MALLIAFKPIPLTTLLARFGMIDVCIRVFNAALVPLSRRGWFILSHEVWRHLKRSPK